MRVRARHDGTAWRVVEQTGEPAVAWLPSETSTEPVDGGGFHAENSPCPKRDAELFALAVNHERALFGVIPDDPGEFEAERATYDSNRGASPPKAPSDYYRDILDELIGDNVAYIAPAFEPSPESTYKPGTVQVYRAPVVELVRSTSALAKASSAA